MGFFRSWLTEKVTDIEIEELRANEIIKTAKPSELYSLINSSKTSDTAKRIYKSKMREDYPNWSPSEISTTPSFSYSTSSKNSGSRCVKQSKKQSDPYDNRTGPISKDWFTLLENATRDTAVSCTRCNSLLPPNVIYCAVCGRRYIGSDKEKNDFSKVIVSKSISAKNVISLGSYYYDDMMCPIRWLILGVNNKNKVVLLSAYALESGSHTYAMNWVKNNFLQEAFTVEERKYIYKSSLLSISQIKSYFNGRESLVCKPTIRAEEHAMSTFCEKTCGYMEQEYSGNCMWWLDNGSIVNYHGEISKNKQVMASGLRDSSNSLKGLAYIRPVITVDKGYLSFINGIRDKSYLIDPEKNKVVSINKGCTIQLGIYKGEVIDWVYINDSKGKISLISKKIIEGIYDVSNVHEWLNNDFYSTTFSEQEKCAIKVNRLASGEKKVLLLGKQDVSIAKKYLGDEFCVATDRVIKSCALSTGKCKWILDDLSFINFRGIHQSKKNLAGCIGIRPVIWVDYTELIQLLQARLDKYNNGAYTSDKAENKSNLNNNTINEGENTSSKVCKKCGYGMGEKMIFCPICGEKYFDKIECCGYEITKEMKFCPICGKKIR